MIQEFFFKRSDKKSAIRAKKNNLNTLQPMDGISFQCISVHFDCTKYNEINILFWRSQKHETNRIWYRYHS